MKKLVFTLFGLMQMVWVMAAAPAGSGNAGNGGQHARLAAHQNAVEIKRSVKPWLIVAVNGEGMMPSANNGGGPKWVVTNIYEAPHQFENGGKPKGQLPNVYETPALYKNGRPSGFLISEPQTPPQK